jgi:small subunit ribosomal protein S3
MGQKVNPIGFRIGIRENWRSRWYANEKKDFSRYLMEDQQLRKHIKKNYKFSNIPCIEIERTREKVNVILYTARPGLIIGKRGQNVDKLRGELEQFVSDREINLEIKEVTRPQVNAQLVAENIAEQLLKRANFRRAMKKAMETAMSCGVLGIKVQLSGRLSGAEMARCEGSVVGKVPLQTLDAHIQYGFAESFTTYGTIGIKVWIYLGKYGKEAVQDGVNTTKGHKVFTPQAPSHPPQQQQHPPQPAKPETTAKVDNSSEGEDF